MAQITLNSSGVASSGSLLLQTNGTTTQATVDTSGNLGLGVTPSAWVSSVRALDIGSGGGFVYAGDFTVAYNAYTNGANWIYKTTNGAARYTQGTSGQHVWYSAASGTAGNAITFTQAMTLDASGNLGIGTTSPSSYNSGYGSQAVIANTGGSSGATIVSSTSSNGSLYFADGTTTDQQYRGWVQYGHLDDSLRFGSAATERARIDSSGNLLINATASPAGHKGIYTYNPNSGSNTNLSNIGTSSGTAYHWTFLMNTTEVGSIRTTSSATTYATSSDYRLKENIAPMTGALAVVAQLNPCTYTWKVDGSSGQGFIAHELQAVLPDAVTGEKDAVNEDGSIRPQGIDTSFLVATLTAAIQELKAEFDAYKASHP